MDFKPAWIKGAGFLVLGRNDEMDRGVTPLALICGYVTYDKAEL